MDERFAEVYARLKGILEPYAGHLHVSADSEAGYSLDLAPPETRDPTTWFGAVRPGKRYVSIYLMPVYGDPSLTASISPALAKRRQGKSCFNFTTVDEPLFAELEALVRTGYERTAGDPAWRAPRRAERALARREAGAEIQAAPD